MEANRKRNIRSGSEYDHLFPRATLKDVTIKKGATVADTVKFIPKVVQAKRWQTEAYTQQELKGLNTYEACEKLWHFIYDHIAYKKDEENLEQIRSPARAWHDRFSGVDCDCYSTFISSVLTNLGIPHLLRIAKYSKNYFQHIYPVVVMADGREIIIDCVVNEFNYEEPYTEIKDTKMDLQLLDGIEDNEPRQEELHGKEAEWESLMGMEELYGDDELGQLGFSFKKLFKKVGSGIKSGAKAVAKGVKATGKGISNAGKFVGKTAVKAGKFSLDTIKKGAHLLNRINPLRLGFLAAMKLNIFNVARDLRLSYLNKDQAAQRNINSGKHDSLVKIRKKVESIFYVAGGESSDLKSAILKGKGNTGADKVLAGLDGFDGIDEETLMGMDENTPLYQVLGPELVASSAVITESDLKGIRELELDGIEDLEGLDGNSLADQYYAGQELEGLGEPATLSIAAASGVLATIAGLIKSIGNIYDKGKQVTETVKSVTDVAKSIIPSGDGGGSPSEPAESPAPPSPEPPAPPAAESSSPDPPQDNSPETSSPEPSSEEPSEMSQVKIPASKMTTALVVASKPALPARISTAVSVAPAAPAPAATGFWEKHKKWLKPTLIGVSGLGIIYLGYRLVKSKTDQPAQAKSTQSLSGLKGKKKTKKKNSKKEAITLL